MQSSIFNERFRQIIFFLILSVLGVFIFMQIRFLMPGVLGAVTLYLINRRFLYKLVYNKKWNKYLATFLIMFVNAVILLIPFGLAMIFVIPKLQNFTAHASDLIQGLREIITKIEESTGVELLSKNGISNIPNILSSYLPDFLSTAANGFINISTMFFVLFFLLYNAQRIESYMLKFIPLKPENKRLITTETKNIVISYAIGIPVLAIAQGLCAYIGYAIFHIKDPMLWGFITCVCSVIPFVGSSIIWVPLVVYLYTGGNIGNATGLAIYCAIVVLNIDNVLRLILLRAFADIHPLITLFGVITGIKLFGFIGLIFGPLLVSYFLLMIRIYVNEFSTPQENPT